MFSLLNTCQCSLASNVVFGNCAAVQFHILCVWRCCINNCFVLFCFAVRGGDRAAIAKCSPFNWSKCRSRTKYGGAWERIVAEPFQHTRTTSLCASVLFVFIMPLVYLWRLVYSDFLKKCLIFFLQYHFKMIPVMRSSIQCASFN